MAENTLYPRPIVRAGSLRLRRASRDLGGHSGDLRGEVCDGAGLRLAGKHGRGEPREPPENRALAIQLHVPRLPRLDNHFFASHLHPQGLVSVEQREADARGGELDPEYLADKADRLDILARTARAP